MLKSYLTGLWILTVPASLSVQAASVRQEIMLERASAPKVVEVLRARFPAAHFILHPTLNGFYVVGPRADILAVTGLIPDLDRYPEEVVQIRYGDFEEVRTLLQTLVPDVLMEEGDEENSLVLRGAAENLEQAKELLDQLDRPLDQVLLECKLLSRIEFPVNWHSDWEGRISETGQIVDLRLGKFVRNQMAFAWMGSSSSAGVLASPRVALNSEQPGEIHIGDKMPVGHGYQDVGLKLESTLTVEDQRIHCRLNGQFRIPLTIDPDKHPRTRTLLFGGQTELTDGETLILDGLLPPDTASEAVKAIPLLGQLPILGDLFRNTNSRKSVYLMITPNLMR